MSTLKELGITPGRIERYDRPLPRYTSYPTAPVWTDDFGAERWEEHLRAHSTVARPLSLYVHVPFCRKRCHFCGCNVVVAREQSWLADQYLNEVVREVQLLREAMVEPGPVTQLHLGGGTPNFLNPTQMAKLLGLLRGAFGNVDGEQSIEVDPRLATPDDIRTLRRDFGFSRVSFGAQDFDPEVQRAIGREQTHHATVANVEAARAQGFSSVNVDLIYGLPGQTRESWQRTLDQLVELRPDRVALYSFAYLPGKLPNQNYIDESALPSPDTKLALFAAAHDRLVAGGWEFIGMDHYALKGDELTVAQREGRLRRNFMGYTTGRGTDLLAVGVSAISDFAGAFAQNEHKLPAHRRALDEGRLPAVRGHLLDEDDLLRRRVIEEIFCNFRLDPAGDPDLGALLGEVRPTLADLEEDGLLRLDGGRLEVTPRGRFFVRNIAARFDRYLLEQQGKVQYSRSV